MSEQETRLRPADGASRLRRREPGVDRSETAACVRLFATELDRLVVPKQPKPERSSRRNTRRRLHRLRVSIGTALVIAVTLADQALRREAPDYPNPPLKRAGLAAQLVPGQVGTDDHMSVPRNIADPDEAVPGPKTLADVGHAGTTAIGLDPPRRFTSGPQDTSSTTASPDPGDAPAAPGEPVAARFAQTETDPSVQRKSSTDEPQPARESFAPTLQQPPYAEQQRGSIHAASEPSWSAADFLAVIRMNPSEPAAEGTIATPPEWASESLRPVIAAVAEASGASVAAHSGPDTWSDLSPAPRSVDRPEGRAIAQPSEDTASRPANSSKEASQLVMRAQALMTGRDILAARSLLEQAVETSPEAAYLLAQTFDEPHLKQLRVRGVTSNPERARALYERAWRGGIERARENLARFSVN